VEKLAARVKKQEKMVDKAAEATDGNVFEELRERKARKLKVVINIMEPA
jgi:hypothetical protein